MASVEWCQVFGGGFVTIDFVAHQEQNATPNTCSWEMSCIFRINNSLSARKLR